MIKAISKEILLGAAGGFALLVTGAGVIGSINNNSTTNTTTGEAYTQPVERKETTDIKEEKKEPVVEIKEEKKEVEVAFGTTYKDDSTLAKGKTKVITEGVNGVRTKTYKVTYTDGVETAREKISDEITVQPVNRVVANGTYVQPQSQPQRQRCANGTYVNSAGNTVCRPSSSNTGGATARCRDGSYSYSQSRRGTCSHHGGVSQWL